MKKNIFVLFISSTLFGATGCEGDTERLTGYSVQGIDISRHQGKVNWDAVAGEGINFAFIKATEGRRYSDTFYCRNWEEMRRVGIKRGAYHFFRPSIDAKEQADNFIATVDMQYGDLPPVVDIEMDDNMSREEVANQLSTWLYLVEIKYSIRPIIYTHYMFYNKFIAGSFDKYPIWIAKYGGEAPRLGGSAKLWFWQYGNKGRIKGIEGYVDLDVFLDTREALDKICLSGAMLSGLEKRTITDDKRLVK